MKFAEAAKRGYVPMPTALEKDLAMQAEEAGFRFMIDFGYLDIKEMADAIEAGKAAITAKFLEWVKVEGVQ